MKYIIFDMDGVLTNTEPLHFSVWQEVLAEQGFTIDYERYKGCIGSTLVYLFGIIEKEYGKTFEHPERLVKRFHEINDRRLVEDGVPPVAHSIDTVKELFRRGFTMAVASSSPRKDIAYCMASLGLTECFQVLLSGEQVTKPKPAPDTFLEAAKMLGADPSDCVVVEDSRNGTRAAKAAGMYCVGFYNPDSGDQNLSAADVIITDIQALPNLPILKGE